MCQKKSTNRGNSDTKEYAAIQTRADIHSSHVVRIIFLGDHYSRELEIAKRTICALKRIGLNGCCGYLLPQDVYATGDRLSFFEIIRIRPDIIVTPTLNKAQAWLLPLAKMLGSAIVIQHSEQFLINAAQRHKYESISMLRLRDIVHLSWTESHRTQLIEHGVPPSHAYVSGSPKLAPMWEPVAKQCPKTGAIGFVSNFSAADFDKAQIVRLKDDFGISSEYPINTRLKTLRCRFIRMIAHNARLFSEKMFVVRAHPGESLLDYENALQKYSNVTFSKDETFSEFLGEVGAVVMHDSTSIFEIAHRKIPVVSVNLGSVDDNWVQQPSSLFKDVRPRDVTRFIRDPSSFRCREQKSCMLQDIVDQMESYDRRIGDIYREILSNEIYRLKWHRITFYGYQSFIRNLLVQVVDHFSAKCGLNIISTSRRNAMKIERYGRELEVVEL